MRASNDSTKHTWCVHTWCVGTRVTRKIVDLSSKLTLLLLLLFVFVSSNVSPTISTHVCTLYSSNLYSFELCILSWTSIQSSLPYIFIGNVGSDHFLVRLFLNVCDSPWEFYRGAAHKRRWSKLDNVEPTKNQRLNNVSCLLGIYSRPNWSRCTICFIRWKSSCRTVWYIRAW